MTFTDVHVASAQRLVSYLNQTGAGHRFEIGAATYVAAGRRQHECTCPCNFSTSPLAVLYEIDQVRWAFGET
jgi:hypothetical protein